VIKVAVTIAIVGSIETLLSLEAGDKIDPFKRLSSADRELKAQGIGNILSGLLGGLPITSVIVRTSANVYAGAKSRWSAIIHGFGLLFAVIAIPKLLNMIPLASLAAILIMVGYKLTKLDLFRKMYRQGWDQFVPFIVTVLAVVFLDLLTGVFCGVVSAVFFILRSNHRSAMTLVAEGNYYLMRFNKDVSFVNKPELKEKLAQIPNHATLIVDGTRAGFIDKDVYDVMADFEEASQYREIDIEFRNFEDKSRSIFERK
jgi:MFS superfamily sulfate permease-like transporter